MIPKLAIESKLRGAELPDEDIRGFIDGFTSGEITDAQMSALAMAICCRGMSDRETATLTDAMMRSGRVLEWGASPQFNITGRHNVHPRAAIAARKTPETHNKYVQFYDQIERETKENEANG